MPLMIAMGIASIASGLLGWDASEKARRSSEQEADRQRARQNDLLAEEKSKQASMIAEQAAIETRDSQKRKSLKSMSGTGRASTILTGPLGLPNLPEVSGKTLLGL